MKLNCRICDTKIIEILDLGKQPLANSLLRSRKEVQKKYELKLCYCEKCKTIQISKNINKKKLFEKYVWNTGVSKKAISFSNYFFWYSNKFLNKNPSEKTSILEIASNDGTFLMPFKKKGYFTLGIDPAKNLKKYHLKNKINTIIDFFDKKNSLKIKKKYGLFDFIFARNVIPHNYDAIKIIENSKRILKQDGTICIEFHYLGNILNGIQYDSIYHEHIFYFSLSSIINTLKIHKLTVVDILKSPISGGALIVYAKKHSKNIKIENSVNTLLNDEKKNKLNSLQTWKKFSKNVQNHKIKFNENFVNLSKKYKNICCYGASARSSTFLNYVNLNYNHIRYIFDKSELKVNKYSPGSKIKIINLSQINKIKPDLIIILAWNFKEEIIKELRNKYSYKNDFFVSFPSLKILK